MFCQFAICESSAIINMNQHSNPSEHSPKRMERIIAVRRPQRSSKPMRRRHSHWSTERYKVYFDGQPLREGSGQYTDQVESANLTCYLGSTLEHTVCEAELVGMILGVELDKTPHRRCLSQSVQISRPLSSRRTSRT